jgi:predicted Zn-dependent protease
MRPSIRPLASWVAILLVALMHAGCGPGRPKAPLGDGEERIIGARLAALVRTEQQSGGDPTVVGYVRALGDRMARLSDRPGIPYTFEVLADSRPRAFALPGGYLYVTTGLLTRIDSQAELAGVLGHALAHVAARHPMTRLLDELGRDALEAILTSPRVGPPSEATRHGLALLLAGYPRDMERQADQMALLFTTRVGLNPEGMLHALEKTNSATGGSHSFWEDTPKGSPSPANRVEALRAEVKRMGLDAGLPTDRDPYAPIKARIR